MTWQTTVAFLVDPATALGDRAWAALLYDLLVPYADRNLLVGGATCFYFGPFGYYLGRLAAALGRADEANAHFETSAELCRAAGARPWLARTEFEHARLLAGRARAGDVERARALAGEAAELARTIGMTALLSRVEAFAEAIPGRRVACLVREGDFWTVEFGGTSVRVPDAKGLRYLQTLLAHPGRSFRALDLAAGGDGDGELTRGPSTREALDEGLVVGGLGDAGETIDTRARAEFRARLREIEEEIEEAESFHDLGRLDQLRGEKEDLLRTLHAAVGLGGRARRAASASERARLAVSRSIRAVRERLRPLHPRFDEHLERALRTGTQCCYDPDRDHPGGSSRVS